MLLLFSGMIPLGIGLILGGIAYWGYKEAQSEEYDTASFKDKLNVIMEAVSLGLVAIGVMLIFFGHVPLGIGLIIAGKSLLKATEAKLNEGGVTTKIQKFFEDNKELIVGVGIALVVIAVILFVCGIITPMSIGLLVAGGAVLAAEEEMNPGAIQEVITNAFNAVMEWLEIHGGLVLGILLLLTPGGAPLGMSLIMDYASAMGKGEKPVLWDSILNSIKKTWTDIKTYWNNNIAHVWTLDFWSGLAKIAGNGLIEGFELAVNGIISMFETMINMIVGGLNKISVDVPDWIYGIGGKTIGFNIPDVEFGRISIPRLAQGAVIPPNREFLAVLGDQKQGTNIEAPLQTIVDAFNIALAQNGNVGGGNTEVVLEIDGREFGRAVVEQGNRENRRIGTRLVIA